MYESDDLIGTLVDAGMSPQEAREMFGPETEPAAGLKDAGAPIEPIVHALLITARNDRHPPEPQVAVPSGLVNSLPDSKAAKPVRVDTEESYRLFRKSDGVDMHALDQPVNAEDIPDMLNQLAQTEAGLTSSTEGEFSRGYASQWITGDKRRRRRHHYRGVVGNIMNADPASQQSLTLHPYTTLGPDQECLLCGLQSGGAALCGNCLSRPDLQAPFQRGYASQIIGLFERGSAASLYDPNPSARYNYASILGDGDDEFYRLQRQMDESATMVGDDFYRLQHQTEELAAIAGDDFYRLKYQTEEKAAIAGDDEFYRLPRMNDMSDIFEDAHALSKLSADRAEAVPLSFAQHDADQNVVAWKQGDKLYSSIRVTGWDGQPRILTAATSYPREVGIVVGYAEMSRIAPSQTLAVLDPLARTLGASRLVPRLAAAAPSVLRVAHGKLVPLVMATMPA